MRIRQALLIAGGMIASSAVFAADYRADVYQARSRSSLPAIYATPAYAPYVPPLYYLPSPPQYVQDLRTGAPGRWVQIQPSFLDRLFGEFRDGY